MGPAGRALRLSGIVWAGAARARAHPSPSPLAARPRLQRGGGQRMTAGRREDLGEKEAGSRVSVFVQGVSKAGTRNLGMCVGGFFSKGHSALWEPGVP